MLSVTSVVVLCPSCDDVAAIVSYSDMQELDGKLDKLVCGCCQLPRTLALDIYYASWKLKAGNSIGETETVTF